MVVFLSLVMVLSFSGCRPGDYKKATSMTEEGNWQGAKELFIALNDYKDAADKVVECDYHIALEKMDAGDYDASLDILQSLGDYADAAEKSTECRYLKAVSMMDMKKWEEASETFGVLGDYKDSAEMISECLYRKAEELMANESFDQASEIFKELGSYRDSEDQYASCQYQKAMKLYVNGKYEAAYPVFLGLEDYKDSDYYAVLSILQYDPNSFVEVFAQSMDQLFKAGNVSLSMKENKVSYETDARYFSLDSILGGREISLSIEPSYSDESVTSRGQISAIHILGDTRTYSDIETTLSEVLISSVFAMTVLDDSADSEKLVATLGEVYSGMLLKFPADIPEGGHFEKVEIPYENYKCEAAVSFWPGYYRFLFMISTPELVMQK